MRYILFAFLHTENGILSKKDLKYIANLFASNLSFLNAIFLRKREKNIMNQKCFAILYVPLKFT